MSTQALRVEEAAAPYLVAPALTDHLDTFASAPEGFKRLRELVLNLAVRGRLVPQDPNDEPAPVLLQQIAMEQSIGRARKLAETNTRSSFDIPNGWVCASLGSLVLQITDGTHHTPKYQPDGVAFISVKDIDGSTISFADCRYISVEEHRKINARCHPERGDILLCRIGTLGRPTIVDTDRPFSLFVSVGLLKLPKSVSLAKYLHLVLSSPYLAVQYDAIKAGGSHTNKLNLGDIPNLLIPLPPLAEQSRIVAKVEELMALIDRLEAKVSHGETARGKLLDALLTALADSRDAAATADAWAQLAPHFDLLLQTPADVDRLQQTLLTLAVKGRLVRQDPNDEPAAELLKRIRAEKERLVTEGKIKREKSLPEIEEDEFAYEVPQDWQRVRLAEIAIELCTGPFGSALHKQDYVSGGIPLVNPSHLRNGVIQPEIDVSVTRELSDRLSGYRLSKGDIVLARRGEVGRCAIVTPREEGWLCGTGSFFLKLPTMANRDFLYLLYQSPDTRNYLSEGAVGATMVNLNQRILVMMPIGLPPLAEQSRIVAAVASLAAICDRLRERLATRRDVSAQLTATLTESALA